MQIPIYFRPFWGSPYQIVPDSAFVNGPSSVEFDTKSFVASKNGWLKDHSEFAAGATRSGAEIVDYVATTFSISPRLLLALVEYRAKGLSDPTLNAEFATYPLGYERQTHRGLYLQLVWAANTLNNGYYGWRSGSLIEFERPSGRVENPDPWQNAASVALHVYFNQALPPNEYLFAISEAGVAQTYKALFGDPWQNDAAHMPGSLEQPDFSLPFAAGQSWAFTGGPHTGWGTGQPLAALDFAPPSVVGGCQSSSEVVTAVAPGLVIRTGPGIVVLDLDQDGDERTGWVIFYLHMGTLGRASVGQTLNTGDRVGHPSCEGGTSTGSHVHVARKYNGEWIPAAGALPFVMEGWTPQNGAAPYQGALTRLGRTVTACECSTQESQIRSSGITEEQQGSGVN
jgi:murein DD-endopeptidase MepM/ murein hydrolase activator NlpD